MSDVEEKEPPYYENFDFAIFSIFTALVFEIGAQFGHDQLKFKHSRYWGKKKEKFHFVITHVRRASLTAIGISLLFIIASAILVSLLTYDELEERMQLILNGLSSITAFIVFTTLSFGIAVWTGLYYRVWSSIEPATSTSIREVKFKIRWSYYRIFGRYFFFLLPFYEGVTPWTIPVSMVGGIAVGLFISFGVYLARRKGHGCWQSASKVIVVFLISVISSIFLANAAWYIASVWSSSHAEEREDMMNAWYSVFFILGIFGLGIMHAARYYTSCRQLHLQRQVSGGDESSVKKSAGSDMMASNRPRMAASLFFEAVKRSKGEDDHVVPSSLRSLPEGKGGGGQNDHVVPSSLRSVPEQKGGGGGGRHDNGEEDEEEQEDGEREEQDVEREEQAVVTEEAVPMESASPTKEGVQDIPSQDDDNDQKENEEEKGKQESNEVVEEESNIDPTYREMLAKQLACCGCLRGGNKDVPLWNKIWAITTWTVWLGLVIICLYLVAVNIGSTQQQSSARAKFPEVERILYSTMDLGPVCAFDNKGADSNITTFVDKDAAHAAGFLIVHCGACAACSDWHNLRLEYTTRNTLAQDSRKCAQKSLTPGGRDAVLQCIEAPPIEFRGKCAECWTDDVLCAKSHCAFIFLQSTLINAVTDLAVSPESITSAACEEANCEAGNPGDFVVCSGATRRRMNVTSDIARPGGQRCSIVDVNWAELFPGE